MDVPVGRGAFNFAAASLRPSCLSTRERRHIANGSSKIGGQGLGHFDAINPALMIPGAGIARALAGREEAAHVEALEVAAARDAQRVLRWVSTPVKTASARIEARDLFGGGDRFADGVEAVVGQGAAAFCYCRSTSVTPGL